MIYIWNIPSFVEQNIPSFLREDPLLSYVKALLYPIEQAYAGFLSYRVYINKKVKYNGQTIILENLLNDTFDGTLRQIRIINEVREIQNLYIGRHSENKRVYIGRYIESHIQYIGRYAETNVRSYDFIVLVTDTLTLEQELQLKAIVNYYRMAGTRPLFKYVSGTIF